MEDGRRGTLGDTGAPGTAGTSGSLREEVTVTLRLE